MRGDRESSEMKFGKQLRYECVSEWRIKYISYGKLKKYLRYLYVRQQKQDQQQLQLQQDHHQQQKQQQDGSTTPNQPIVDGSQSPENIKFDTLRVSPPMPSTLAPNIKLDGDSTTINASADDHEVYDEKSRLLAPVVSPSVGSSSSYPIYQSPAEKEQLFMSKIKEEIKKINEFFSLKEKDIILHYNKLTEHCGMILKEKNPSPKVLKNIQKAFAELYKGLTMLENYVTLNYMGFSKILKKFDKMAGKNDKERNLENIEKELFYQSKSWRNMKEDVELLYCKIFKIDKLATARIKLRPTSLSQTTNYHMLKLGFANGFSLAALAFIIILFVSPPPGNPDWSKFVSVVPIFRAVAVPILAVWLWGANIPAEVYPITLVTFFLIVVFFPFRFFHRKSRLLLFVTLGNVMMTPFGSTKFRALYLGDVLTSMVKTIFDWEYTACYIFSGDWEINSGGRCNRVNQIALPIISGLPLLWRFMQCILRYRETKQRIHLGNCSKYAVGFSVVLFSALNGNYLNYPEPWTPSRILWCICFILATLYMYVWDVLVDWGFMWMGKPRPLLRQSLMYKRYLWAYYYAIFSNLIFRFAWTLSVTPLEFNIGINSELFVTILATVELFRRFTWSIFRVENEHISNSLQYHAFDFSEAPWKDEIKNGTNNANNNNAQNASGSGSGKGSILGGSFGNAGMADGEFPNSSANWYNAASQYYSKNSMIDSKFDIRNYLPWNRNKKSKDNE
ncbi:hypothetical protein DFA_10965 [Cavenderia fasciculata]|uniref:SPX domain-containing protein n=1 Tax=Cavenderia fasciculata TaxID=261658 RepID=F4QBW9_CACFS|nr:uncharacterized protein DFA_10965 [Cavenderia fasciculata]EGG14707.1 hypothetical protein DFA_10965 [Cavenderia fasciculata]|eukprot:XP_004351215.1 hypothetical protein DFA_10965 [Cavenderia fasciculata]